MCSNKFKLEARSAFDCGWYDCSVTRKGSGLVVKFDEYGSDDEEHLKSLEHLRFISLPAEDHHCKLISPGTRVSGFKRSASCEIWVDAEIVKRVPGGHSSSSPCNCSFTVRWLDTAQKGHIESGLRLLDICLPDPRPLSAHPHFHAFQQALEGGQRRLQQVTQVPDTPPGGSPSCSGDPPAPPATQPPHRHLRPPPDAKGPACLLCHLATVPARCGNGRAEGKDAPGSSAQDDFEGLQLAEVGFVHRRCATWSFAPALKAVGLGMATHVKRVDTSLNTALREVMSTKCCQCNLVGAAVQCSAVNCKRAFHMHCAAAAKVDWERRRVLCPAHAVLGGVKAVAGAKFYDGKEKPRQGKGGTNLTLQRMLKGTKKRQLDLQPTKAAKTAGKGQANGPCQGQAAGIRRSYRKSKKVNYAGDDADDGQEGSEYEGDELDEEGDDRLPYEDDSDVDLQNEDDEQSGSGSRQLRRRHGREKAGVRKSERSRRQVKTYDESRAEQELLEEATREAARVQANGYEDTHCQVCHSKARAKEMLLCDCCDLGWHMGCLTPPLNAPPLASWFCPGCLQDQECEACGRTANPVKKKAKKKAGASPGPNPLDYCSGCGAVCHPGCMQSSLEEEGDTIGEGVGSRLCKYCVDGLTAAEAILGCRQSHGRREYYLKFKDASYRRCAWVREATAVRMCPGRVARFERDTRGAANVEPNVQSQWVQVERVIAVRAPAPGHSGSQQCFVKWRGLSYGAATWESLDQVDQEAVQKYERRMALRVERQERWEAARRERRAPQVQLAGPGFLRGVGTLKDYQLSGITWLLSKLHANMSVILGDEMGLGKTIQTAVFLQLARQNQLTTGPMLVVVPLSTIGSWERELSKWSPGLEVLAYNGDQESRAVIRRYELGSEEDGMEAARQKTSALIPRFHVMLTTYEVADKDAAVLRRFAWSGMVIDEGHRLKGENSKLGAQLRSFGAPWRLLLTGTPLQNNLRELFALLAFMADTTIEEVERHIKSLPDPNPPPDPSSRRCSPLKKVPANDSSSPTLPAPPIDPETLEAQAYVRRLHAYLEPRMLRRLKHNTLLGELPAKITRRVACRLSPLQRQLYADLLARNYDAINSMARNRWGRKSMNNLLMRLRQACNHPYLFPGQEPEDLSPEEAQRLLVASCGKLSVLQQMMPRLLHGGHRVLVFSQSTELLNILEDFLHGFQDTTGLLPRPNPAGMATAASEQEGSSAGEGEGGGESGSEGSGGEGEHGRGGAVIPFYRIDGSTKLQERQAMIDSFNSPSCKVKVFLMSTRAGSLGINLQSADTVILYDPDFNPFVDAQAEGRAHRLGQQRTVIVYQMFTAHTVEQRILDLAAKKRRLEEVVTKHLGREKEVSNEDLKSSLSYGWGNLMCSGEDGHGDDVTLRESDVAALLDRSRVQEGDLVIGADAGSLLGEVLEGGASAMSFERQAEQDEQAMADAVMDSLAEERMLRLLAERAQKFDQEKQEAKAQMGGGRRGAGRVQNYLEESDLEEFDSDASPGMKERWRASAGAKTSRKRHGGGDDADADYNPLHSPLPAVHLLQHAASPGCRENDQPNKPADMVGMCSLPPVNLVQCIPQPPPSPAASNGSYYTGDRDSTSDSVGDG